MPVRTVRLPSGGTITINAPVGASERDVLVMAERLWRERNQRDVDEVRRNPMGRVSAALDGFAQGGSFNTADEIASVINSVVPGRNLSGEENPTIWNQRGNIVDRATAAFRGNQSYEIRRGRALSAAHPVSSGAGRVVGTALAARRVPGLALAPEAAVGARIGSAAVQGARTGFLEGAGAGDTLDSRARSATGGAAIGGVGGAAVGATGEALAPVVRRWWSVIRGRGAGGEAVRQLRETLRRSGYDVNTPEGREALEGTVMRVTGRTLADLGKPVRNRTGVGLRTENDSQVAAERVITERAAGAGPRLRTAVHDNVAPRSDVHALDETLVADRHAAATAGRAAAITETGPGRVVPGELTSRPMQGQGYEHLEYMLPDGRKIIGAMERLNTGEATVDISRAQDAAGNAIDPNSFGPNVMRDMLSAFRTRFPEISRIGGIRETGARGVNGANTMTTQVVDMSRVPPMSQGIQPVVVDDPILQNLVRTPMAQRAMTQARALADQEYQTAAAMGHDTSLIPRQGDRGEVLDMRTLDYLKRYMDRQVNQVWSGRGDYTPAEAPALTDLRNNIRARMSAWGESAPGAGDGNYARYLRQYGDDSEMVDALKAGRTFNQMDPEQIATGQVGIPGSASQTGRSPPSQELYRVGVARNLIDRVNAVPDTGNANPARALMPSPTARDQIAASGVPTENMARLQGAVDEELNYDQLVRQIGGSDERAQARAAAESGVNAGAMPFNPTFWPSWLGAGTRAVVGAANLNRNAAVNAEFLPRALTQSTSPVGPNGPVRPAIMDVIQELVAQGDTETANAMLRFQRTGQIAAVLGGLGGNGGATREWEQ